MKIRKVAEYKLQTEFGPFQKIVYENTNKGEEYVALVVGNVKKDEKILVRIHSQCFEESLKGQDCDCGQQLWKAMKRIQRNKVGVLVYLFQEGKGHGLKAKAKAKSLMEKRGIDIYDAYLKLGYPPDSRKYDAAAAILKELKIKSSIKLLTNNPNKVRQLEELGFKVYRVKHEIPLNEYNTRSLSSQQNKYGHLLNYKFKKPLDKS